MRSQALNRHRFVTLIFMAALVGPALGDERAPKGAKPLPAEILQAWTDAGAEVRWIPKRPILRVLDSWPDDREGEGELIPEFGFSTWDGEALEKLPDPGMPFGLSLFITRVTDVDLKALGRLKSLRAPDLRSTEITDAGLKHLAGLKELAGLKTLEQLEIFSLSCNRPGVTKSKVTDEGMKALAGLVNLRSLDLNSTQVTDAGLKHLAGLKKLRWLQLAGTKVTPLGVAGLQMELPGCRIVQ